MLAVHRALAQRRMHDLGGGRLVVPLLEPTADDLPFAVALELHRRAQPGLCSSSAAAPGGDSSFQLHYVLQGAAQVGPGGPPPRGALQSGAAATRCASACSPSMATKHPLSAVLAGYRL